MKALLMIFGVLVLVTVGQKSVPAKNVYKTTHFCKMYSEVNEGTLKKAQQGEWSEDISLKKFYACYLNQQYIVEDMMENEILEDQVIEYLKYIGNDKEATEKAVEKCYPDEEDPLLERSYNLAKCLQQEGLPLDVSKLE